MLKAKNISKYFDKEKILHNISLHLEDKKIGFLLGESGSGKSTFIKILAGLLMPEEGKNTSIALAGEKLYPSYERLIKGGTKA